MDFRTLIHDAGFNNDTILAHLGISRSTYRRYCLYGAPRMAIAALEHQAGIAGGWEGLYFRPGEVQTPTGYRVAATQIETYLYARYINREIGWREGYRSKIVYTPAVHIEQPAEALNPELKVFSSSPAP